MEVQKLLYIVVVDDDDEMMIKRPNKANVSFRYTRPVLQSTLQLMGCKPRHAFKISCRVFEMMRSEYLGDALPPEVETIDSDVLVRSDKKDSEPSTSGSLPPEVEETTDSDVLERSDEKDNEPSTSGSLGHREVGDVFIVGKDEKSDGVPFELYKRRTTAVIKREIFLDIVCYCLSQYKYVGPNQRADLVLSCRIRERKESVTVLLCGTSGCGKSTLSALLGSRLGITTVISTDCIRHMMRSFVDEKENPLLWASTYHAGEFLDPVGVSEAKAKRKAKKLAGVLQSLAKDELSDLTANEKPKLRPADMDSATELIGTKQMVIEGFKAQSEMVIDSLDRLITAWEGRKESVVVEGVHLSLNFVMGLMKKHPSIIPFMIYITNEDKHVERFAVRAKYMTLDPARNKYVKYIRNIRTIQEYLCNCADKHLVPKINNTNVDRSVAAIHATVFSCLRRREAGEQLYDLTTNTVALIDEEYRNQCAANSLSSKGMFQLIQRKGSSRHLMVLLNTDGSVAKAWPVEAVDDNRKHFLCYGSDNEGFGSPMYGPLQIGRAEPVNLQFGNFGISAWPNDASSTSHSGSVDESRADGTETGSRYYSSCCSSPRISDGPAKELKEDFSVCGSDDEAEDPVVVDSDEDHSDGDNKEVHEEMEGSVDDKSMKSDEYEDLAMHDGQENGYCSDDDEDKQPLPGNEGDKYHQNLILFIKTSEQQLHSQLVLPDEDQTTKHVRG